jgi:hypothetical protein
LQAIYPLLHFKGKEGDKKMRLAADNNLASDSRLHHRLIAKLSGSIGLAVSLLSVDAQATYILPARNITAFFNLDHEYMASSHFQGNTFVFGGTRTLQIPRPPLPKK